jgi:hypothetical protein
MLGTVSRELPPAPVLSPSPVAAGVTGSSLVRRAFDGDLSGELVADLNRLRLLLNLKVS